MGDADAAGPAGGPGRRMPGLDGVRGLAILAVLAYHLAGWWPGGFRGDPVTRAAVHLVAELWVGVDLFFVLSGFLITGILLDSRDSPGYFRAFYGRRALRIFPLYYGVIAAVFLVAPALGAAVPARSPGSLGGLLTFTANLATWPDWHRDLAAGALHMEHFWSLAVEEQFYLIWPAAVLVLGRRGLAVACAAIVAASPLARAWVLGRWGYEAAYVLLPCRADAMAAGAALALAARSPGGLAPLVRPARSVLLGSAIVYLAVVLPFGHTRTAQSLGPSVLALAGATLVTLGAASPAGSGPAAVLGCKSLRTMGRYSYTVYVLHGPLMGAFLAAVGPWVAPGPIGPAGLVATEAAGLAFFLALAVPVYHVVEAPALRLRRFIPSGAGTAGGVASRENSATDC